MVPVIIERNGYETLGTTAVAATGVAILLFIRGPFLGRVGFFLGFAALSTFFLGGGEGSWDLRSRVSIPSRGTVTVAVILISFLATTPYILLLETGIAGSRGFSSWVRFLSLALAILGGGGLIAAFLLPRMLRRHSNN